MPSFLRDLRRRSKASFRTENSSSNESANTNGSIPYNKSSSTLSSNPGSSTPPSETSSSTLKNTHGPPIPPRPGTNGKRQSSTNGPSWSNGVASPLAPRVTNASDNSLVHQQVLLVSGTVGDGSPKPLDGSITIYHAHDAFPPTQWPVYDSHFKALVYLQPGPNKIRLDFTSPKISSPNTSSTPHSAYFGVTYIPLNSSPPLQLAIILGKDSPGTYDAVPERTQREGNDLKMAVRKFRMMAYLWQAFTAEQMYRNGFGRRCFRFEEEWTEGTLTYHDTASGRLRNEPKIHIIRVDKTVRELRDLDIAQQYDRATNKGALFTIALDAVKNYFSSRPGMTRYVTCLFLDAHWDPNAGTIRGHAALGGGDDTTKLAIFGSHCLQSYPASIEEVVPAFTDCTRTDTRYVANDCNESGSSWEAANIGIGAHLHEVGHLFGCPHQDSGIMLRDYVRLNRTFVARESYSTRTKSPGQRLCLAEDECSWHRLDCLRFRFHPCFRLPIDHPQNADDSVQSWAVDNGNVVLTATSGLAFIELYPEGDSECHSWIEYSGNGGVAGNGYPRQVTIGESDLRAKLPQDKLKKKLKVEIYSCGQGKHVIEDFGQLTSKASRIRLPSVRPPGGPPIPFSREGFRGPKYGFSQMENSQPQEIILDSAVIQTKLLTSIRVHHGFALDGIEFIYEDSTSQLFGKRGGKPGGSEFLLDTRRSETVIGFYVRSGVWIDGIQILTSLGRRSEIFGNATGGSGHMLIPPRGYSIAGLYGSCGSWIDGFGLIITR